MTTTTDALCTPSSITTKSYQEKKHNNMEQNAFRHSVANVPLPDPPPNVQPIYDTSSSLHDESSYHTIIKVPTRFNYISHHTTKVILHRDPLGNDSTKDDDDTSGMAWFVQNDTTWVENGRLLHMTLHENGFELLSSNQYRDIIPLPTTINFMCRNSVLDIYYPHCQQLLQHHLCNQQQQQPKQNVTVYAFDHNIRVSQSSSLPNTTTTTTTTTIQKPIGLVHGDYTTTSGPLRVQQLGDTPKLNDVYRDRLLKSSSSSSNQQQQNHHHYHPLDESLIDPQIIQECMDGKRRYSLINIWRNIDPIHPVMAYPLACVDSQTHTIHELRELELHYTDRIGGNYLSCLPSSTVVPSSTADHDTTNIDHDTKNTATIAPQQRQHRWVYYPHMVHSEALLIKQWDSAGTMAQQATTPTTTTMNNHHHSTTTKNHNDISTFALHSAFIDPTTPNNAPPRQSIEVRCVAIWDPI